MGSKKKARVAVAASDEQLGPRVDSRVFSEIRRLRSDNAALATRLLWAVVVLIHAHCAWFYGLMALVYHKLPTAVLNAYLRANELTIDPDNFATIAIFYAICTVFHAVLLLDMLCRSIRRCRLYFHRYKPRKRSSSISGAEISTRTSSAVAGFLRTSSVQISNSRERVFGIKGAIGFGGKNFAYVFLFREVSETILQSIQAYQLSKFAPHEWLNHVAVLVVSVSCWSTPAIQHLVSKYPRLKLILCLLLDIILDFVSSVGVSIALVAQYLPAYDPATTDFRGSSWGDNVWVAQLNNEFKLLFIQSWVDFGSRALFALTLLLGLDDVKMLVVVDPSEIHLDNNSSVTPSESRAAAVNSALWGQRGEKMMHAALVLWGCVILALHIKSTTDKSPPDCKVQVRPWLSSKPACNYMDIDCAAYPGMVGKADELEATWKEIDPKALQMLISRNCPEFHMPTSIQTFPSLSALLMQNLRIQEWSHEAALSSKYHPTLRQAAMVFVDLTLFGNGSVLPPGLMSPDFPQTLGTVYIGLSGVTDLPLNLDKIWPPGINMIFLGNGLTVIPDVFFRMNFIRLNLQYNQLRELPPELFEIPTLKWLGVDFNPLQSFPARVQSLSASLLKVGFGSTNVSALPDWMLTSRYRSQVVMTGLATPYCDALHANDSAVDRSTLIATYCV